MASGAAEGVTTCVLSSKNDGPSHGSAYLFEEPPGGWRATSEVAKLTEDAFKGKLDFVKEEASKAGRAIALSSTAFMLMMTESPEKTEELTAAVGAGFGVDGATARRMPISLAGTPEEMVEELKRRKVEWGLEHFIVNTGAGAETLARFATEVMPRV